MKGQASLLLAPTPRVLGEPQTLTLGSAAWAVTLEISVGDKTDNRRSEWFGATAQSLPTCPPTQSLPHATRGSLDAPSSAHTRLTWEREGPGAWGRCQLLAVSWGCCGTTSAWAQASGFGKRLERTIAAQV